MGPPSQSSNFCHWGMVVDSPPPHPSDLPPSPPLPTTTTASLDDFLNSLPKSPLANLMYASHLPPRISPRRGKRSASVMRQESILRRAPRTPSIAIAAPSPNLSEKSPNVNMTPSTSVSVDDGNGDRQRRRLRRSSTPDSSSVAINATTTTNSLFLPLLHVLPEQQAMRATLHFNPDYHLTQHHGCARDLHLSEPQSATVHESVDELGSCDDDDDAHADIDDIIDVYNGDDDDISVIPSDDGDDVDEIDEEHEILTLDDDLLEKYMQLIRQSRQRSKRSAFDALVAALSESTISPPPSDMSASTPPSPATTTTTIFEGLFMEARPGDREPLRLPSAVDLHASKHILALIDQVRRDPALACPKALVYNQHLSTKSKKNWLVKRVQIKDAYLLIYPEDGGDDVAVAYVPLACARVDVDYTPPLMRSHLVHKHRRVFSSASKHGNVPISNMTTSVKISLYKNQDLLDEVWLAFETPDVARRWSLAMRQHATLLPFRSGR